MTYEDALAILRDGWPIAPEELTQIAADIWDQGYYKGSTASSADVIDAVENLNDPNPYRASETA